MSERVASTYDDMVEALYDRLGWSAHDRMPVGLVIEQARLIIETGVRELIAQEIEATLDERVAHLSIEALNATGRAARIARGATT